MFGLLTWDLLVSNSFTVVQPEARSIRFIMNFAETKYQSTLGFYLSSCVSLLKDGIPDAGNFYLQARLNSDESVSWFHCLLKQIYHRFAFFCWQFFSNVCFAVCFLNKKEKPSQKSPFPWRNWQWGRRRDQRKESGTLQYNRWQNVTKRDCRNWIPKRWDYWGFELLTTDCRFSVVLLPRFSANKMNLFFCLSIWERMIKACEKTMVIQRLCPTIILCA